METGEFILRAEDVTRDFYRKSEVIHAVRGVNVNIRRGTFNILCGRSGSGKTTFINMLAAIDTPTSGKIFFEDVNIALLNERKRDELRRKNIGIIFQNTALLAQMSAVSVSVVARVEMFRASERSNARTRVGFFSTPSTRWMSSSTTALT